MLSPGDILEPYVLIELISAGRHADVWRAAEQARDQARTVVIKVAKHPDLAFRGDGLVLTTLAQPNLVRTVMHARLADGRAYVVQEDGGTINLRRVLSDGALELGDARTIIDQLARGLAAIHAAGLVHGAITPEHVVLRGGELGSDRVRVTLLGLGTTLGAAASGYLAPEQLHGRSTDPRSDVFALAAVAVEMLSGCSPFFSACLCADDALARRRDGMAPRIGLPDAVAHLRPVLARALAELPADRWPDLESFTEALTGNHDAWSFLARGSRREIRSAALGDRQAQPQAWWEWIAGGLARLVRSPVVRSVDS